MRICRSLSEVLEAGFPPKSEIYRNAARLFSNGAPAVYIPTIATRDRDTAPINFGELKYAPVKLPFDYKPTFNPTLDLEHIGHDYYCLICDHKWLADSNLPVKCPMCEDKKSVRRKRK